MKEKMIRGINILNPVEVDREYYMRAIDYAIANHYNHIQINGPIHDPVRSNLDGMMFYRKYRRFNDEKDADYVRHCMDVVNEALERSHAAGIKTYMWHHELEIPNSFRRAFPEILNEYGDVEVSHPIIKDFLENKIEDFFQAYPLMDGFVLTYFETKVPLLRLKKQKLTNSEIMTYVTRILYDSCKRLGKELIVRNFASVEKDYRMLLQAYERVDTGNLMIMDKWTQFDWSLSLPGNGFLCNIQKNPLIVETDLFGEFFGKGMLPLMLKEHIQKRFAFCEQYHPIGYCSRIDRGGASAFGTANEVNLHIMNAVLNGRDPEEAIATFFETNYGFAGETVRNAMEKTEGIVRRMLFANRYYYSELSWFPSLNHCKNHFYFELMREFGEIASNEWFVPVNYHRGPVENIFDAFAEAKADAMAVLESIKTLKSQLPPEKYRQLDMSFTNLALAAECWEALAKVFFHYVRHFDEKESVHADAFYEALEQLEILDRKGKDLLGDAFYCNLLDVHGKRRQGENILDFVREVRESFAYEDRKCRELEVEGLTDYIVCGGGCESHRLKKEVNFSDTALVNGELVRMPGNRAGMEWSTITAHGWFSYRIRLKKNSENTICIVTGSATDTLKMRITVGEAMYTVDQPNSGKTVLVFPYFAGEEESSVRVRVEKISSHMPLIYEITVL